MTAYYNEIDPYAAEWLRNLIAGGHIAPGEVDERSIEDVTPNDLRGFTQCHFFAGIGVWSYALRQAGWSDDRPVWTGSCPCQPFSSAGKGAGFADERHLWPSWSWLIKQCRPSTIFGEQVRTAFKNGWFDKVANDMEMAGYAIGAQNIPGGTVGSQHKRDRLYFVAYSNQDASGWNSRAVHGEEGKIIRSQKSKGNGFGFGSEISLRGNDGMDRKVPQSCLPLLVDGSATVLAQNSAYGNAIISQAATKFIEVFMECQPC
ncbi:Modification methylase HhaI [Cedecea lapagei]|uniref:Modification methylase HhaI n=1 Tax=Cedecea lapagei TaxID=158823 RepID=A0A3S4J2P1_9ENTR|nr:DNA cytosine methyltransferase [Cedecea lapagei]VEB97325.1 Modification methylase HhaI [Cedecea lapagei]VEB99998.1 Modification methylase HhaI [Cedecea lapagei]